MHVSCGTEGITSWQLLSKYICDDACSCYKQTETAEYQNIVLMKCGIIISDKTGEKRAGDEGT